LEIRKWRDEVEIPLGRMSHNQFQGFVLLKTILYSLLD
jgi:hypothetical protein